MAITFIYPVGMVIDCYLNKYLKSNKINQSINDSANTDSFLINCGKESLGIYILHVIIVSHIIKTLVKKYILNGTYISFVNSNMTILLLRDLILCPVFAIIICIICLHIIRLMKNFKIGRVLIGSDFRRRDSGD